MVLYIMDYGKIIKNMEKENKFDKMVNYMMDIRLIIIIMAKAG